MVHNVRHMALDHNKFDLVEVKGHQHMLSSVWWLMMDFRIMQDLLEIEAMKIQALREVQEKLKNEMVRRRGAAVSGNESGGS